MEELANFDVEEFGLYQVVDDRYDDVAAILLRDMRLHIARVEGVDEIGEVFRDVEYVGCLPEMRPKFFTNLATDLSQTPASLPP